MAGGAAATRTVWTIQKDVVRALRQIDRLNARLGPSQRLRGLHYWLGFEYALALTHSDFAPRSRLLDVGTGGYSIWPYILAHVFEAEMVVLDVARSLVRQKAIRDRATRAGFCRTDQVHLVRADARRLPFPDASFDGFTAMSSIEHVQDPAGDRQALREVARTLRPNGRGMVTVPFRRAGSVAEIDQHFGLYQRHYSEDTLSASLLGPSGLEETSRTYYGERWPLYRLLRRLPQVVRNTARPWNATMASRAMRVLPGPENASAVLIRLAKRAN